MEANVDVTEMLGSETFIHFNQATPPVVTPDIEELLADSGADASSLGNETKFSARVSSDVTVRPGDRARLVIDSGKFHFFDVDSGDRIGA
jgi:multiple sugar transport system ATP-binding protein